MMKLNCLIVDDEPLARKGLEEYVSEIAFLQLAGSMRKRYESLCTVERGQH